MTQQPPPGPPGPPPSGPPSWGPPPGSPPPQQPPPPPPPGGAGMGTLVVHLQGSVLTSNMITPTVRVNGYPVPASYGPNSYPLAPGRWHVDISAQWLRTYGQAALEAEVAPGQMTQVYYAAPVHQFTTGNIGFTKQKRKGWLPLLALLLVVVAVIVAVALL